MTFLYGHNPLPTLTKTEEALYQYIDDTFRPASFFRQYNPHINKDSASVALVRLRNRGLIESIEQEHDKNSLIRTKLWRRK